MKSQSSGLESEPVPYGSARDFPSFQEMSNLARGAKFLTRIIARHLRPQIAEAERELNRLIALA